MLDYLHHLTDLSFLAQDGEGSGRGFWFIALVIILAIQHISEKLKEKRAAQELDQQHDDEDEWHNQVEEEEEGYREPNPTSQSLLEFFRNAAQTQAQPEPVVRVEEPPPPPPPPPPELAASSYFTGPGVDAIKRSDGWGVEVQKLGESNLTHGRSHRQRMHSSIEHTDLKRMLGDPVSLRNAFILKEILDPPVASREQEDPYKV